MLYQAFIVDLRIDIKAYSDLLVEIQPHNDLWKYADDIVFDRHNAYRPLQPVYDNDAKTCCDRLGLLLPRVLLVYTHFRTHEQVEEFLTHKDFTFSCPQRVFESNPSLECVVELDCRICSEEQVRSIINPLRTM